jgi:hypothetical protein
MKKHALNKYVVAVALCLAPFAIAQPPAGKGGGPGRGQAPLQSPNPHYDTVLVTLDVNKPAAAVWARVGKFCDIGEWAGVPCTLTSGKDGELGAVRSLANEILVGKTEFSYTYTQPVREGQVFNMYHGTLEVRPVSATTSKIVYTLVWDNSMLADDAARTADHNQREGMVKPWVDNMKILAEGGALPPRGAGKGKGGPPQGKQ